MTRKHFAHIYLSIYTNYLSTASETLFPLTAVSVSPFPGRANHPQVRKHSKIQEAEMADSVANFSDLLMNKSNLSNKKSPDTDDADCIEKQIDWSPSGANTLNLGMQTGTSRGDIDQTAAGQLSDIRAGKRQQEEIDRKYRKRTKSKLVQGKEISMELQKLKLESEQLKKCSEWFDEHIQKDAKSMEEFQSQISSLISINGSQNQHINSFFLRLLDMYEEKDELKKEIEYLKKLMIQQQPVGFDTNQVSREN